jgi:hypothetical protein
MTTWAHWRGLIARTGVPTTDGRLLVLGEFEPAHFVRLPVAVTARPKPVEIGPGATSYAPFEVVGRVDRVSVRSDRRPPGPNDPRSKEIHAEGVISLDALYQVRPDLRLPEVLRPNDDPLGPWPVGVDLINAEIRQDGDRAVCSGPWELMGLAIEHEDSVWPGVGIMIHTIEGDGRLLP